MDLYDKLGQRKYLNVTEWQAFLRAAAAAPPDVGTFCQTLAYSGCRISEALQLTAGRVDVADGVLVIESLKKRERGIYRAVPVPPSYLDTLASVHGVIADRERGGTKQLWNWSRSTAWRRVCEVMEAAGITGTHATPKGLRHGFGVRAISSGIPLNKVQAWLGHADLSTTAIYCNAIGAEERLIASRMWTAHTGEGINDFLSNQAHDPCCGCNHAAGSADMVWRIFRGMWKEGGLPFAFREVRPDPASLDTADDADGDCSYSSIKDPSERKRLRREKLHNRQRKHRLDEQHERERKESEDTESFLLLRHQQALRELFSDIEDAIAATRLASLQAAEEENKAREALENARRNAITLPDDRLVYFSRDGQHLYGEDHREISDETALREAQRLRDIIPRPTSYEAYTQSEDRFNTACALNRQLAETLDQLDDLETRLKAGRITPDELIQMQEKARDLISTLPAEAHAHYERRRSLRREGGEEPTYRNAEFEPDSSLNQTPQANRSTAQTSVGKNEDASGASRPPVYKAAPEF